jgi:hypothetical protein
MLKQNKAFLFPEKQKTGYVFKSYKKTFAKMHIQNFLPPLLRPGGIFMQFQQSRAYDAVNLQVFHE